MYDRIRVSNDNSRLFRFFFRPNMFRDRFSFW